MWWWLAKLWLFSCMLPTLYQGIQITLPVLFTALLLRLIVLWGRFHEVTLNTLATVLGLFILWWFYGSSVMYFIILCVLVYALLMVSSQKGVTVSAVSVIFILSWYVIFIIHHFLDCLQK